MLEEPAQRLADRGCGGFPGQPIVHPAALLPREHKAGIGKNPQVPGHRTGRELQQFDQLAGAALAVAKGE